jgi:hypothetical protein
MHFTFTGKSIAIPLLGMYHRAMLSYSLYFSEGSMQGLLPLIMILCEFFLVMGVRGTVNLIITSLIVHPFNESVYRAESAAFYTLTPFFHITHFLPTIIEGNIDGTTLLKSFADYPSGV